MTRPPSATRLRRLALSHQGLAGKRKIGSGASGVEKTLERLGYVQIDTISVVARAHHHTLFTRVAKYDEAQINALVRQRCAFEYWAHAAAYLPMRDYRYALPMMRAVARGEVGGWHHRRDDALRARVKDRIREEGPLFARDFEDSPRRGAGWWNWKPAKRALEQLFMEGELMSVERQGFQKRYELAERALPPGIDTTEPDLAEHADHVIDATLAAHGFATRRSIAYQRRDARVRAAVGQCLKARVAAGDIERHAAADGELLYCRPGTLDAAPRRAPDLARILSPFDNVVIQRRRCAQVFGFDYTIECYVPEAKRRYGYYVLPILFGDRFAGRMDCKAHRQQGRFEIKALFLADDPPEAFLPAFRTAVLEYAAFTGCGPEVDVGTVSPRRWTTPMRRAFA